MNNRIMKIVDVLLNKESYITIDNISNTLNVSNKTIRNDLQIVEEYLNENNLQLIKKTGVGICIKGSTKDKLLVMETVKNKNKTLVDFSPKARQIHIGMQLCIFDNCRIYELSRQLYVSRATIHKDIISLTETIEPFKISIIRKNNNGITLAGKEKNIRNYLLELMLRDNGYQTFIEIIKKDNYACNGSFVYPGLEVTDDELKDFIHLILHSSNQYINSLSFPSLIHVLLRMFVAYLRIQDKHFIQLSDSFVDDLKKEPFYKDARNLCDRLSNHYRISIPEIEIRYLQVYFLALQNSLNLSEKDRKEAMQLTHQLISSWSNKLNLSFHLDQNLIQSVYEFLCPAIIRFRHGIPNENPLMQEIKNLYAHTFEITKESIACLEKHFHCKISDDEIGFLTLYLAVSLDNMKKPLQTILVTHGGVAASKLLYKKLSSQIPEIHIVSQENIFSLYDNELHNIDLIISTIELNLHAQIPIIQVNSLVHDYDITRLRNLILKYFKIKNDPNNFKKSNV